MSISGIAVRLQEECSLNFFSVITSSIRFKDYDWFVKDLATYKQELNSIYGPISGKELQNKLKPVPFFVFGKFIGYPLETKELKDITSYDTFIQSDALIVLLVWDVFYYNIYCKDEALINELGINMNLQGLKFELIDEDDSRTRLDVW